MPSPGGPFPIVGTGYFFQSLKKEAKKLYSLIHPNLHGVQVPSLSSIRLGYLIPNADLSVLHNE